jgi:hypothetical protein
MENLIGINLALLSPKGAGNAYSGGLPAASRSPLAMKSFQRFD